MKTIFKKTTTTTCLACVILFMFFLSSCEKKDVTTKENITLSSESTGENSGQPQPCCTVSCEKGSCSSYGTTCHCTCTFLGKPDCLGSRSQVAAMTDSEFDGRDYITLNSNFLELIAADQAILYSLNKTYATEVADKLDDFTTLIHTHGYTLNSKQALLDYYDIVDYVNARESQFTTDELMLF